MFFAKHGQYAIAAVCVVLGIMLAVQFRTTRDIHATLPFQRIEDLSLQLETTQKERDSLAQELQAMRSGTGKPEGAAQELEAARYAAGLTDVHGPGVVVTIDDSKRPNKMGDNPNLYLIHDDDLLKVINELFAAGSEAVSINGQRLVATSEIRCAGPALSVNNTRYSPPYEIRAIGNIQTLENALKMRGGVVETLQFWGIQINIAKANDIIVPAYKGSFHADYAKAYQEGEKP